MDFTDHVGALLEKLSAAYVESSQLQKQRDEALEKIAEEAEVMKSELEHVKRKLFEMTKELEEERKNHKNERKCHEKSRRLQMEAQAELSVTFQKLSNATRLNKSLEDQLKFARKEISEKDKQIKEMEEFILDSESIKSNDSGNEVELEFLSADSGARSAEGKQLTLSPIPEENPDEIPYYYDACIAYADSLQIVIGSDSKSSMLSISDADDSREVCVKKKKKSPPKKKLKVSSTVSNVSEKENSPQKIKKRKQYKVLFGFAHY